MRSTLGVSMLTVRRLNSGYMSGFDLGGGGVYRGLLTTSESGRQRLRAVIRNRQLL